MHPSAETEPALAERESQRLRRINAVAAEILREAAASGSSPEAGADREAVHAAAAQIVDAIEEDRTPGQFDPAGACTEANLRAAKAAAGLLGRYRSDVEKVPPRLGVCPSVVFRALSLLRSERATLVQVEKIAGCDPVLATSLLSHANSAMYRRSLPVQSVGAAIAYIGVDTAKRVILAASARPLFSSIGLRGLWEHSVDIATIAEQLTARSGAADPAEAFAAGLIHDLGRLALELNHNPDFVLAHRRLEQASGSAVLADAILSGMDHGEVGALLLGRWRVPESLVNAVRLHHRPELSGDPLPSILYLAEEVSAAGEGTGRPQSREHSMKTAKVTTLDWLTSDLRRLGTVLSMVG